MITDIGHLSTQNEQNEIKKERTSSLKNDASKKRGHSLGSGTETARRRDSPRGKFFCNLKNICGNYII